MTTKKRPHFVIKPSEIAESAGSRTGHLVDRPRRFSSHGNSRLSLSERRITISDLCRNH